MKRILFGISLITALVGLFSLILLSEFSEPEQVKMVELESRIGQRVIVQGEITKIAQKENVNFFEVKGNTGKINVVAFGQMGKLAKGLQIKVYGKVTIYQNELEIIADKIEVV